MMSIVKKCSERNLLQQVFLTAVMLMILIICIFTIFQMKDDVIAIKDFDELDNDALLGEYLVDSENCQIPNLRAFSIEAMSVFKPLQYKKCYQLPPLTSIDGDKLIINEQYKKDYLSLWQNDIKCCYKTISRSGLNETADEQYKLSKCKDFVTGHVLNRKDEFILVRCVGYRNVLLVKNFNTEIYRNAHATIMPKLTVEKKFEGDTEKSSMNVLLVGIDSISRLNLIRTMPYTFKYLKSKKWFDMKAFNKIAYNTFPNLMAILTGMNDSIIEKQCNWKDVGGLDKCQFLWNDYNDANYVTIYAEDSMSINTFNYYHTGFINQPTDYYFRPFGLAAEDYLKLSYEKTWLSKCIGYQHYADYVYQYGVDFASKYKNDSFFGLLWTNSFSHDDLSAPSEYDVRMKFYLEELERKEILNNTIVMFFSDHGMRFGDIRKFFTGWLEERLPFLFFWLPEKFKIDYPEFSDNLLLNENRLVSPYDLHVTMKHILKLSGKFDGDLSAESCETCQSLFYEIPHNRTCREAGIESIWCTCNPFMEIEINSDKNVKKVAQAAVDYLNVQLSHLSKCAKLKLHQVSYARQSHHGSVIDYLVSFIVLPSKGQMEATIRCSNRNCQDMHIIGEISRINRYGDQSSCISDANLRKYCYCVNSH